MSSPPGSPRSVSTDPGGRLAKASFVGAKIVNGPGPFKVPAISATPITVTRVVNRWSPERIETIFPIAGMVACVPFTRSVGGIVAVSVVPGEADVSTLMAFGTTAVCVTVADGGVLFDVKAGLVRSGGTGVPLIVGLTAVPDGGAGEVMGGTGVVPGVTTVGSTVAPVGVMGRVDGGWEVVDCIQPAVQRDAIMSISAIPVMRPRCIIIH